MRSCWSKKCADLPVEVMQPRQIGDDVDDRRDEHEGEDEREALLRERPCERSTASGVAATPPRRLPHQRDHDRGEHPEPARPLDGYGRAERDPGRVSPRTPQGRRDVGIAVGHVAVWAGGRPTRRPPVDPSPIEHQDRGSRRRSRAGGGCPGAPAGTTRRSDVPGRAAVPRRTSRARRPKSSWAIRATPVTASVPAIAEPIRHPNGSHPERLDPERDRPFPERWVDERAHVPLLFAEQALVRRLDLADLVGAADEDARRLRVVVLVEHERRRARQAPHPDHGRDRRDGEDRHPGTVQPLQER